ncbi:cell division protein PerM, partial [Actinomadura harenae]
MSETGRQRVATTGETAGATAGPSTGPSTGDSPGTAGEGGGTPRAPVTAAGQRPQWVTGLVGAVWCIGIGLAVLTTITLVGWIAAPRTAFGHGLPGVFRTAVNFWLVSHHAGFSVGGGRVGLLPLGVLLIPGALLYRTGGWMIRRALPKDAAGRPVVTAPEDARRAVVGAAVALAVPYAALAGLLA